MHAGATPLFKASWVRRIEVQSSTSAEWVVVEGVISFAQDGVSQSVAVPWLIKQTIDSLVKSSQFCDAAMLHDAVSGFSQVAILILLACSLPGNGSGLCAVTGHRQDTEIRLLTGKTSSWNFSPVFGISDSNTPKLEQTEHSNPPAFSFASFARWDNR